MAGLAYLRAVSYRQETELSRAPRRPPRVPSCSLIDRMKTIPEDREYRMPSPGSSRRNFAVLQASGAKQNSTVAMPPTRARTLYESDEDALKIFMDELGPPNLSEGERKAVNILLNLLLSVMTVLMMVTQTVITPLYVDAMSSYAAKSDPFVAGFLTCFWLPVIFFSLQFCCGRGQTLRSVFKPPSQLSYVFVAGTLAGLTNILVTLTSLSMRTPTYLHGILQQTMIPFTAICRYFIIGKGITSWQVACMFVLLVGIFFTLEPTIFQMRDTVYVVDDSGELLAGQWYFNILYAVAWLPLAIGFVLMEKVQNAYLGRHKLAYIAWFQLFAFLAYFLFFWLDFVPGLGLADYMGTSFLDKISNGFMCFFGAYSSCSEVPTLALIYITAYGATTLFSVLLIRHARSSVYAVVVLALVPPVVALFWTLFQSLPYLHYSPVLDTATIFILIGLLVMMPAVILYASLENSNVDKDSSSKGVSSASNSSSEGLSGLDKNLPPRKKRLRTRSMNEVYRPNERSFLLPRPPGNMPRPKSTPILTF